MRFVFGGGVTALAGYLNHTLGATTGGLFLAFPAILPAALTLIHNHQGKGAAERHALGAISGSIGLFAFAILVWQLEGRFSPGATLSAATAAWLIISLVAWLGVRRLAS